MTHAPPQNDITRRRTVDLVDLVDPHATVNGSRLLATYGLPGWAVLAVLVGVLWAAAGCAGPRPLTSLAVYPPPPAPPRLALMRIIETGDDVAQPGFFGRIGRAITGHAPPAMAQPHGLAVNDRYIAISDQKAQAVLLIDRHNGQTRAIDRIGDTFLVSPVGIAFDGHDLIIADSQLAKVFVVNDHGRLLRTLEPPGGFHRPTGIACDPQRSRILVVDTLANELAMFDLDGRFVSVIGSHGTGFGEFNYPTHVAVDARGRIYVTDSLNFRVQIFDPQGRFVGDLGELGDASGFMAVPKGVGVDREGHIYVVDSYLSAVQVFDDQGRFLLAVGKVGAGPGEFHVPTGLTVGPEGRLYVADSVNRRIQVFEYLGEGNQP